MLFNILVTLRGIATLSGEATLSELFFPFYWNRVYHIYRKYLDTLTSYHTCSRIWTSTTYYLLLCLKIAGWVANRADPDEMPQFAASHQGLRCLLRPVCPNTYDKYITLKLEHSLFPFLSRNLFKRRVLCKKQIESLKKLFLGRVENVSSVSMPLKYIIWAMQYKKKGPKYD